MFMLVCKRLIRLLPPSFDNLASFIVEIILDKITVFIITHSEQTAAREISLLNKEKNNKRDPHWIGAENSVQEKLLDCVRCRYDGHMWRRQDLVWVGEQVEYLKQ